MNYETTALEVRDALKVLSLYSFRRLSEESIRPDAIPLRKSYNYGLFIMGQSLLDGIITLAARGHVRDMSILLRSLQEAWVNASFSYAGRSHVWVYYLALRSEKSNLKKMEDLYHDGLTSEEDYLLRKKEYDTMQRIISRRYPALPVVPEVIKENGNRNIETRTISFRQQCQIIDFYQSGTTSGTFVKNYETVYSYLSETVHVSPRGINTLFSRDEHGNYSVDISGGQNRRLLIIVMINAFLYHYDLMRNYNSSISTSRQILPTELKQARRRLISLARQIAR